MPIAALRTPDERFADLPDFPWAPQYTDTLPGFEGLRMAFLDEGPRDGHVVLCLHGEPSWSFLYRKMIPVFLEAGHRVVAPDLFGFGRSDKPTEDATYSFDFHRRSLAALIAQLGLSQVTLVCQDWGGLLGLTLPVDHPDLVARLLVMNTALGVGRDPGPGFLAWQDFVANNPDFEVGRLMRNSVNGITEAAVAAYQAPFPDRAYMAGARTFPLFVPTAPDHPGAALSRQALDFWRNRWDGPTFMAIGMQDPVLGPPVMHALRRAIRGCPEPMEVAEGGHFVQEHGAPVARAALQAWGDLA
jgi:haloalkane dehalogenase/tRNA(adenine34) deaminase